ncbi:hypothetical protein BG36_21070 [Aquamicrobium defluvii]|uniref:Uncharacterized protein n=1 Tax=Aquamicrobium defluvii TaxID=69279 RepID=A0A011VMG4_9HYPH|nr:hypothetical protein BG36_21070 [Aquamicrobium defluvii]EZQ16371.1 hypothetical protein CF98_40655 [Halopseudomonas bauzanensis]
MRSNRVGSARPRSTSALHVACRNQYGLAPYDAISRKVERCASVSLAIRSLCIDAILLKVCPKFQNVCDAL